MVGLTGTTRLMPLRFSPWKLSMQVTGWSIIAVAGTLVGAPIKCYTLSGNARGATLRVLIGRTERDKACGLDKQFAGFKLQKGRILLETFADGEPMIPTNLVGSDAPQCELRLIWPKPALDLESKDSTSPSQMPEVAATDPAAILPALRSAIGDSLPEIAVQTLQIRRLEPRVPSDGQQIEVHFPTPRSGVSKARQFRIARRLVSRLLADLDLAAQAVGTWPPGFPSGPLICNYDAEGVGYFGSTLLERAVDETTLNVQVVSVCPEDIREGALDQAIGVMFPGGSGKSIATALRPDGVDAIRKFVASGHGYYGVCAGAYLAASGLDIYSGMIPLKHHQPWAKGKSTVRVELTAEGKSLLGEEFSNIETRYNCGPVFTELDHQSANPQCPIQVLGRFVSPATDAKGVRHDEMIGTPAILATQWGKGRVLIVSPHPESHPQYHAFVARCIGWTLRQDLKRICIRNISTLNH